MRSEPASRSTATGSRSWSWRGRAARRPAAGIHGGGRREPPTPNVASALLAVALLGACAPAAPRYRDSSQPVAARVADLLGRMTAEDKFWQLVTYPDDPAQPADSVPPVFGLQVRAGTPDSIAARMAALQRRARSTRLGIPLLFYEEALHGLVQPGATAFPQAIGLAATWDTALVGRVATTIAAEALGRGVRMVLSPVLNVATDQRWGRVEETYGEDPFLAARMAVAFVAPFERRGVATTPKHFVANLGEGGRDSWPADVAPAWLGTLHLPPFDAAVREAGARLVMASYNSVDGRPASANAALLDTLLRRRWGFGGVVISDAGGVGGAVVLHHTAADYPASAVRAVTAGLDVIFQGGGGGIRSLFQPGFASGAIPLAALDQAVSRVLTLKFELGLFDRPAESAPAAEARDLALLAGTRSLVLLRNERILPLSPAGGPVALIGPDAAAPRLGGYSGPGRNPVSLRAALEARLGPAAVRYSPGPGRESDSLITVPPAAFDGPVRLDLFADPEGAAEPKVTRTVPAIDALWTLGPPDSALTRGWYRARWTGRLRLPPGRVTLAVEGPDGWRLTVDGRTVLDRSAKRTTTRTGVSLPGGGSHDIALEYVERVGPAQLRLLWNAEPVADAGLGGKRGDAQAPAFVVTDRPAARRRRLAEAVATARGARVAIVAVGLEEGEFRDRSSLRLPGLQAELIDAIARTGVPVVVVVLGGSAVITEPWLGRVGALLQAWYPGERGGDAIAAVLLGEADPGGRLPVSFPKSEGQLPLSYFHRPTGRGDDYLDGPGAPEFPFGYGLSYTTFGYDSISVGPGDPARGDSVAIRFIVTNTGSRAGREVAQLYLRPETSEVAWPVLSLAGFAAVDLAPGERRAVTIRLAPARFTRSGERFERILERGRFDVLVGRSSADPRLRATVTVGR